MNNECLIALLDLFKEKALKSQVKKLETEFGEKISNKVELISGKTILTSATDLGFESNNFLKCHTRVLFEKTFSENKYIFKSDSRLEGLKIVPNYSGFELRGRIELVNPVPLLKTVGVINKYNVNEWSLEFIV